MATNGKKGAKRAQYLMDNHGMAGRPDKNWSDKLDYGSPIDLHQTNLYDENETQYGDLIDPATGKPYKNDHNMPSGLLHSHVDVHQLPVDKDGDVLGDLYDPSDEADALLNKPAEEISQKDIDAMVQVLEEQRASRLRHPTAHRPKQD